jgi:hypothetical protein
MQQWANTGLCGVRRAQRSGLVCKQPVLVRFWSPYGSHFLPRSLLGAVVAIGRNKTPAPISKATVNPSSGSKAKKDDRQIGWSQVGRTTLHIKDYSPQLLARETGLAIRAEIATLLADGSTVEVDMEGIEDITPSVG